MLRFWLGTLLIGSHLALVAAGAARCDVARIPVLGATLAYYSSMTGAKAGYGFFAPDITGQAGAEFEILDGAGRLARVPLAHVPNHEVDIRINDTVEQFAGMYMASAMAPDAAADPATRDMWHALAASLCGTVIGEHPEGREVVFRLRNYTPVSMRDYRGGLRSSWSLLYEARFRRAPPGGRS